MKNKTGKINTKSNAYLENSLVALSESIQNRLANRSRPQNSTEQTAWNINDFIPQRSFGLLVATEL